LYPVTCFQDDKITFIIGFFIYFYQTEIPLDYLLEILKYLFIIYLFIITFNLKHLLINKPKELYNEKY